MIEIDFREFKYSLNEKLESYRETIIKWAYTGMMKNVEELYKNIQNTL
jgi:hypothetical protein